MIIHPITDQQLLDHLEALEPDGIDIFILDHGNYRGAFINGTRMVNQMRANHEYGVLESFIAGHAHLAAGLLTSNIKGNDRIELNLDCKGTVQGISAESTAKGTVRGFIENNPIIEPTSDDQETTGEDEGEKFLQQATEDSELEIYDMSPFIGEGALSVTKKLEDAKSPFTGFVSIEHGNIAQDLTYYFLRSEQIPTAFNLSIRFDKEGRIIGAGGLMVQAFPSAEESTSRTLDSRIRTIPSLGSLIAEGTTGEALLEEHFSDVSPVHVGRKPIEFYCHCTKERFARFLRILPAEEIRDIRDNGPFPVKTTCFNCNSTYEFSYEEIDQMLQEAG